MFGVNACRCVCPQCVFALACMCVLISLGLRVFVYVHVRVSVCVHMCVCVGVCTWGCVRARRYVPRGTEAQLPSHYLTKRTQVRVV